MKYVKNFKDLRIDDVGLVGGKNASIGEMISQLGKKGIKIPSGFATTADAYWYFLKHNNFDTQIKKVMAKLKDHTNLDQLQKVGHEIRMLIESGSIPDELAQEIKQAYEELSQEYGQATIDVAVRSSATAEDLPTASFAGQQETFLNIRGDYQLLQACIKCIASLFTNRAIVYRIEKGFDHFQVALSVGVQKMVRSDLASSGVAFSLDTESGFKDVVMIDSSFGLGESIVQGLVNPDEFFVHKPTLEQGFASIIKKKIGKKQTKIVYTDSIEDPVMQVPVELSDQKKFSLSNDEILTLARQVCIIEDHYSAQKDRWVPMDVEWAKDGIDGTLYILQARPETVHGAKEHVNSITNYHIKKTDDLESRIMVSGQSIGQQIVTGIARVIEDASEIKKVQEGDIIVTAMTDPDWVPAMKRCAGIITDRGGRTCHAAIVSRELGIPAIVGASSATQIVIDGQEITIDCTQGDVGVVYSGRVPFEKTEVRIDTLPELPVKIMVNIADPGSAFKTSFLPVDGVGLARLEFIISNVIKIHPMALLQPERIDDPAVLKEIEELTAGYPNKQNFFIESLAQGMGMIAAAFYPNPVMVRLSDFKSNEYRNLIGGRFFERQEENPMLGFRGASRYYHENYRPAFALECAAIKMVRDVMGLVNVKVMVPFVRTLTEADKVIQEMARNTLKRGENDLEFVMMTEVPSNVILVDEFSQFFDGFSIGSNDLTQLTLGVDRDSEILARIFDERDPAVKKMFAMAIEGAHRNNKFIGICGQAPSDYPEIAEFLIEKGIDSLSLNPDSVLPFMLRYAD